MNNSPVFPPQLIHGDSLMGIHGMDTGCVDLALIDPPYFDYKTGRRKDKTNKISQSLVPQSQKDQLDTVQECIRVLKDNSFYKRHYWGFTSHKESTGIIAPIDITQQISQQYTRLKDKKGRN